jgi:cobalt-zinc-cadmium efflux system outer membrane protein
MRTVICALLGAALVFALPASSRAQPAAPLTLGAAVARGLAHSPVRQAASLRAEGATVAARLVPALPNPVIELRGENLAADGPPLDFFAVLTQPVELGGKRGARRAVATADRDLATADLEVETRRVALDVAEAYLRAVRAQTLRDALASQRADLSGIVDALRRRLEEGVVAEADLRKLEAEANRVGIEALRARLDADRASSVLGVLLGADPASLAGRLVVPQVPPPETPDLDRRLDAAVEADPGVALARARHAQALTAARLEGARGVPDLGITGGYKRTADYDTGVLGVVLAVPVFERNRAGVVRAEAAVRAAELEVAAARAVTRAALSSDLATARELAARARETGRELIEPADVVRTAARTAYSEGGGSVLGLVDAERVFIDARRTALDLHVDAVLSAVRARLALGEEIPQ